MNTPSFPAWIRRSWSSGAAHQEVKDLLDGMHLHTVCQSAHCPNQAECWGRRTATLMILGKTCSRHCKFCAVNSGQPEPVDAAEPEHAAEAVARLQLKHAVITSVTRDDLPDGGAAHFAATVRAIKEKTPETTVEVLVPDFGGDTVAIQCVLDARPEVFGHNIETVERLHPQMRDRRSSYAVSLAVLRIASAYGSSSHIKSGFMVGCGETEEEVRATLQNLRETGCAVVSIGQYLQPTAKHYPVVEYITPEQFSEYEAMAYAMGFAFAVAGPFVRSSYRSDELLHKKE
jgi:lipoyl synthase